MDPRCLPLLATAVLVSASRDIVTRRSPGLKYVVRECRASSQAREECARRDIFVFGVYTGDSVREISQYLRREDVAFRTLWGMDSFRGLPDEQGLEDRYGEQLGKVSELERKAHGAVGTVAKVSSLWATGRFSTAQVMGASSLEDALAKLTTKVAEPRVRWIPGFFNESLTHELAQRVSPALFVDMDCDLYSSTEQALSWLLTNRLLSPSRGVRTVISYDDWGAGGANGQSLAHRKVLERHNATAKLVADTTNNLRHPEYVFTQA